MRELSHHLKNHDEHLSIWAEKSKKVSQLRPACQHWLKLRGYNLHVKHKHKVEATNGQVQKYPVTRAHFQWTFWCIKGERVGAWLVVLFHTPPK